LAEAVFTRPTGQDWLFAGKLLILFSVIVTPLGFLSGLTTLELTDLPWRAKLFITIRAMVFPAMVEEGFWRVLLLPHKTERMSDRKRWLLGLPVLAMFVLMHPFNGMTFYPEAFSTFTHPIFLISTTLLGLICMMGYWRSGSLWVPVIIHWIIVAMWLLVFGGYAKMHS
jgi:predicted Abi (CAAX) family protease